MAQSENLLSHLHRTALTGLLPHTHQHRQLHTRTCTPRVVTVVQSRHENVAIDDILPEPWKNDILSHFRFCFLLLQFSADGVPE